jgi:hypothetical protein
MPTVDEARELGRCYVDPEYFAANYCKIYDSVTSAWIPFDLWPAQREALRIVHSDQLVVILKARQVGLTWLCLSYALWQIIFRPIAAVGLFSRRDTEALYLLGQDRLRGMYKQLPDWMKTGHETIVDSGHEWTLSNGSAVRAFPTSAGDSYVSTLAIVDEADLSPDLNRLMRAVKPTIDNGGKLVLLSRADKTAPESEFKSIYRAAKRHQNGWGFIFLPWDVHPGRDAVWYERQKIDIQSRTGALDDLHEQYPKSDTEALAPRSLDKRISPMWIEACYDEMEPVENVMGAPAIPGLEIYKLPSKDRRYVIGGDPAEGNPTSDDSALTVLDWITGEECAVLANKFEPGTFGGHIQAVSVYYNNASAMVERNNHGHAVIQWLGEHARRVKLLNGHDDKPGWMSSKLGKALLYTECADHFRSNARMDDPTQATKILHSFNSYQQLASIEGATLRAPEGQHDDRADSFALAQVARAAVIEGAAVVQSPIRNRGGSPNVRRSVRRAN